jgi:autotransporter-associated beta strand protein
MQALVRPGMLAPAPLSKFVARFVTFVSLFLLSLQISQAGSASWQVNPQNANWTNPNNWAPDTVPNGANDIATFQSSSVTSISLRESITLDSAVFPSGASSFTISLQSDRSITFSGAGVLDTTETNQLFILKGSQTRGGGTIFFNNSADAGSYSAYQLHFSQLSFSDNATAHGATMDALNSSVITFAGNASAGTGYVNVLPQTIADGQAPQAVFMDDSTAASASVSVLGATKAGRAGGIATFRDRATAANAYVSSNGAVGGVAEAGTVAFLGSSTAGNALLVAGGGQNGGAGGTIYFNENSTGGTAYLVLSGNGNLDISGHASPGMSLGAVYGDGNGNLFLGGNNLTIGSTNYFLLLAGSILDGGASGGNGGSLTKVGTGVLTLTHANTYSGGMVVQSGTLSVNNQDGSATGSGPVRVEALAGLTGAGAIGGKVTIAGSSRGEGVIAPGTAESNVATLTIRGSIRFGKGAYFCSLDRDTVTSDTVVANGANVASCDFQLEPSGSLPLPVGKVFTVLDNTSSVPILGTFPSYPEGAIIELFVPPAKLQISYEGGDGNDITLTVVP